MIRPTRQQTGFTLLELMVASGITIFLVGLLIGMISAVTSGWQRVQGSLSSEGQARLILDQLAADLEGAIFKPDGSSWLAFSVVTSAPAATTTIGWRQLNERPATSRSNDTTVSEHIMATPTATGTSRIDGCGTSKGIQS